MDPSVIMLVGRVATNTVLKSISSSDARLPISKVRSFFAMTLVDVKLKRMLSQSQIRGRWYEHDGRLLMPVFHPAYLLRNPQKTPGSPKAMTWLDIQEIRRKMDERQYKENKCGL